MEEDDDDYEVGYGNPPKHSQFKKGQSGNPKGRRKGARNLRTDLSEELREMVTIREGGREVRLPKQRVFIKGLVSASMKGDSRARRDLIDLWDKLLKPLEDDTVEVPGLTADEKEAVAVLMSRLQSGGGTRTEEPPSPPKDETQGDQSADVTVATEGGEQ